jgi:hypothetical protein
VSVRRVEMAECVGLWRRTLLIDADGSRDTTTDVRWLQGLTAFVDLRRPVPPDPAAQDGFAGRLQQHDDVFEWTRFVGLRPAGEHPDAGRMRWDGDVLVETGVHDDYVEHWVLEPAAGPCWALNLFDPDSGEALLLRVGEHFGWAQRGSPKTAGVDEISMGFVGATWEITDSSDSSRHGVDLAPRLAGSELTLLGNGGRTWTVKDSEGEVNW